MIAIRGVYILEIVDRKEGNRPHAIFHETDLLWMTGMIVNSKRHLVTSATEKRTLRIRKDEQPLYPQSLVTQFMPESYIKVPKLLRCSAFMLDAQGLPAGLGNHYARKGTFH